MLKSIETLYAKQYFLLTLLDFNYQQLINFDFSWEIS